MAESVSTYSAGSTAAPAGNGSSTSAGLAGRVKERAAAQLSNQKDRATDSLGSVASAVRQSTQQLRDQQHETIANYVEQAATQLERFAQRLKEKDIDDLVADAQRLARRNPAAFIGSAFAIGVLAARFLKSSNPARDYQADRLVHSGRSPGFPSAADRFAAGSETLGATAATTATSRGPQARTEIDRTEIERS